MTNHDFSYPPRLMSAVHASYYLALSKTKFLRLVEKGDFPEGIKIGRRRLWDRLSLDRMVEIYVNGVNGIEEW